MNAVELHLPDGTPTGAFMCGVCHRTTDWNGAPARLPKPTMSWKDDPAVLADHAGYCRERAEACCTPTLCRVCEKPTGKDYYMICDQCSLEEQRKKEAERFEKATKLNPAEVAFDCPLYNATADRWHRDLEDAEEWYGDNGDRDRPAYLWLSTPVDYSPCCSEDIESQMGDRLHEDAAREISTAEWAELDDWVAKWWERVKPTSYDPDFSRCVLLGEG